MLKIKHKEECPHILRRCAGDECTDWCKHYDKLCLVWCGLECEEWEDIKQEWAEEVKDGPD